MDDRAFEELVLSHRRELLAHCYRMLGSLQDAEDAVQESLLAAWRGIDRFEGRSSLRTWFYRIATNCCLRQAERRGPRLISWDHGPARSSPADLGEPVAEPIWLDPWPTDPAEALERHETIGLAYVAALHHLPPTQRAVLILCEVLALSAQEVATMLDTSTASVSSALQRARAAVADRVTGEPELGEGERAVLDEFVSAWQRADLDGLVALLSDDVRFTMPPLPAWFDGRADVRRFIAERVFATPWRLVPIIANAQPGHACYRWTGSGYTLGAVTVLSFLPDRRIRWIAAFLDPDVTARFGLPQELPQDR